MNEDRAIEEMVGEALGRHGIDAVVVRRDNGLEMYGKGGAPVWIDAALDIEQWPLLPQAMRERKAQALASRLAHMSRGGAAAVPKGAGRSRVLLLIAIAAAVGLGLGLFVALRLRPAEAPLPRPAATPTETREQRRERLARACDATRAAMYRGATFGSMAMEGWVVELWLARRGKEPLGPPLRAMVEGDRLAKTADEALAGVADGSASVEEGPDGEEARPSAAIQEARLVLREGYARAFFELETRERFVALAGRLAGTAEADFGALYARCAHLRAHDVGAWFHGRAPGNAAAALVYQMGLYAGVPVVERSALVRLSGAGDLEALATAAAGIDAPSLMALVREDGGRMAPGDRASVSFPFSGPTRATSASRAVARKLGMAPPG